MIKKCTRCKEIFEYLEEDTYFDYSGSYYDTKLVKCKKCGNANILYYYYYELDYNNDSRYYDMVGSDVKGCYKYHKRGIGVKKYPLKDENRN